jgi:hypothetical protein
MKGQLDQLHRQQEIIASLVRNSGSQTYGAQVHGLHIIGFDGK